jgi:hypothetical protein
LIKLEREIAVISAIKPTAKTIGNLTKNLIRLLRPIIEIVPKNHERKM